MSFHRFLRGASAALVIASCVLTTSCADTVRGAVITIDTELCEPGDGAGPAEYSRLEVTISRTDGRGGDVRYCATFDGSDPECATVEPTSFPLVLPVRSDSGMGGLEVSVNLLDTGGAIVACASGTLTLDAPMMGSDIRWGALTVRRSCGGECETDALVPRGDWSPTDAAMVSPLTCGPPTPEPVLPIRRIAVGGEHACLVDNQARAFCWGNNTSGQLGTGDSDPRLRPTFVRGLEGVQVADIAAGTRHTCAVIQNGISFSVRCWGENGDGQLGNGFEEDLDRPANTMASAGAQEIAAGPAHSCARFSDGTVKCWGSNRSGELGDAGIGDRSLTPVIVPGVANATAVSAGGSQGDPMSRHSCALTTSGAMCWGSNTHQQLGHTGTDGAAAFVDGLPTTTTVVSPGAASTCAVDGADGRIWCWGRNNGGTLGRAVTGTVDEAPALITSTIVASDPVVPTAPAGAAALEPFSSGDNYRCFIDDAGAVWCFGNNLSGRLGSAEAATAVEPILVPTGTTTFEQVGVGGVFACALPDDGGLPFCWGASTNGMSGTGRTDAILPPTQIMACD